MNVLFADQQIDNGDGQDYHEQNDSRRRGKGGISSAVSVEHIVDVADDGIHLGDVELSTEERDGIAVRLERAYESRDNEVK